MILYYDHQFFWGQSRASHWGFRFEFINSPKDKLKVMTFMELPDLEMKPNGVVYTNFSDELSGELLWGTVDARSFKFDVTRMVP